MKLDKLIGYKPILLSTVQPVRATTIFFKYSNFSEENGTVRFFTGIDMHRGRSRSSKVEDAALEESVIRRGKVWKEERAVREYSTFGCSYAHAFTVLNIALK